ncbi:H4MPT-linked C1 transfer pathway protein [Methylomonas sp. SURF-2]|uniref:H4MPT-linked C1 transfer pathway protein n=1 Tax=Methylomonas subterranea TaxID=2952225 RepID=A0ABT1TJR4_9GAMM|nr:hydantoinase/oxoprolinase family protein [Methylomonas sp. SURF-2]MCQ8105698.1 H4MPT-linked C1 transfer pathway protein [Methylomonas sp. SURF-2]
MQKNIIGWDIGGAHVKAALVNQCGEVIRVIQQPCPLWKGLAYLRRTVAAILAALPEHGDSHAVTMTGELADCFSDREHGVRSIIQTMKDSLPANRLLLYAGSKGFVEADKVETRHYACIASANWIATAELAAQRIERGLLVDIGSTTTDILLLEQHALRALGYSDYQRLVTGELVYTGIVRTAVMAVTQQAEFNGQSMGLMGEYFANMADVYRLTGDLNEAHDQCDTADGAEKTPVASARRLSRMTGYDFAESDWPLWLTFARGLKDRQKDHIRRACLRQMQRSAAGGRLTVIGAGVGRFLAREIADQLELPFKDFNQLLESGALDGSVDAADCAPAVAVAYLARAVG